MGKNVLKKETSIENISVEVRSHASFRSLQVKNKEREQTRRAFSTRVSLERTIWQKMRRISEREGE